MQEYLDLWLHSFYTKIMISSTLFLENMTFTSNLQVQMFLIDPVVIKDINQTCSPTSERGGWIQCSFYATMERAMSTVIVTFQKWFSCYLPFLLHVSASESTRNIMQIYGNTVKAQSSTKCSLRSHNYNPNHLQTDKYTFILKQCPCLWFLQILI